MLFNSLAFFIFFPIVTVCYFVLPHRFRWLLLLIASCIFYMAFIPIYLLILAGTIVIDYAAGILIERSVGKRRKVYLLLSIISNIGILVFFKYYNFAAGNIESLAQLIHWNLSLPILKMLLPIGLSFHTFQALSYTIEVYRGNQKAEKHFGIYALYVMFFPQLVAGPIERPQNLLHQFREPHVFDYARVTYGLKLMLWGLFKKVVIADRAALVVDTVYNNFGHFTGLPLLIATLLFSIQIYCDFSGYSDIAIGAAQVLGFKLMKNFDQPYASRSVGEFWRRWHISLSTWFKDYVYIPLGGNRVGTLRQYRNILIVFFLSGLWHGANWTFIVWGLIHGFYLIISGITAKVREKVVSLIKLNKLPRLHTVIQKIITFTLVCYAWVFFRADSFDVAKKITQRMWSGIGHQLFDIEFLRYKLFITSVLGLDKTGFIILAVSVALLFLYPLLTKEGNVIYRLKEKSAWFRWGVYYTIATFILLFGIFVKHNFIYFQF